MISNLASPSVCVIDDEEPEYRSILAALNDLYVSCVHVRGDTSSPLPPEPFKVLRLVFTDLHLSGTVGKDAASHAANVFLKVVSAETAPVVVVIWSKYATDRTANPDEPPEDQETEADLFKRTLLEAEPKYRGRLIFIEMTKPKTYDRPADWVGSLKTQIENTLKDQDAVSVLWRWESLVREAGAGVSEGLTSLAQPSSAQPDRTLEAGLKDAMRLLARAQSDGNYSAATAPRHLAAVLAQLLVDQLENSDGVDALLHHGKWLDDPSAETGMISTFAPQLNAFLLTAAVSKSAIPFSPGTVYAGIDDARFNKLFGVKLGELIYQCFTKRRHDSEVSPEARKTQDKIDSKNWQEHAKPVLVEISPACDVAQGTRRSAILIAGLILPSSARSTVKSGDAFQVLPTFSLRWPMDEFGEQDAFLVFCSRYKVTHVASSIPEWFKPWFRLRELPTTSLRNWHAGHASRVGYVSLPV